MIQDIAGAAATEQTPRESLMTMLPGAAATVTLVFRIHQHYMHVLLVRALGDAAVRTNTLFFWFPEHLACQAFHFTGAVTTWHVVQSNRLQQHAIGGCWAVYISRYRLWHLFVWVGIKQSITPNTQ